MKKISTLALCLMLLLTLTACAAIGRYAGQTAGQQAAESANPVPTLAPAESEAPQQTPGETTEATPALPAVSPEELGNAPSNLSAGGAMVRGEDGALYLAQEDGIYALPAGGSLTKISPDRAASLNFYGGRLYYIAQIYAPDETGYVQRSAAEIASLAPDGSDRQVLAEQKPAGTTTVFDAQTGFFTEWTQRVGYGDLCIAQGYAFFLADNERPGTVRARDSVSGREGESGYASEKSIYRIDLATGERQEIVADVGAAQPHLATDGAKLYYTTFKRLQAKRGGEPLKVGLIYSFGVNEDDSGCGLPEENFDVDSLDTPDRDFLEEAIADYNAMYKTNFSTKGSGSDGFNNYYKDLSARLKNREIDLVIVVNMFLTGFDATTLNTLWVDKDLRLHGLIQAFSRTNRILNAVKDFGNIVCFRDLEDEVNAAISLFGDKDARGIVLLKPYREYLAEYRDRLAQLREMLAPGEEPLGEEAEKAFIRLWGTIMRLRNILTSFDEFAEDDDLAPRDEQDYRSVYKDLYQKYRPKEGDAAIINDDLVFEIELLKQVDINIDYILMLVQKYHDGNCKDKVLIADVGRAVAASYELRNKRDLIEQFIDSLDHSDDVEADWRAYIAKKREAELSAIIADEKLDDEGTHELVERAFRGGGIPESGTEVVDLMTKKPSRFGGGGAYATVKQRILDKLKSFYERFAGIGA